MFSGCSSVCACFSAFVRACVRAYVPLARYLRNQWTEFHQTLVDDVVEGTDERRRLGVEVSSSCANK